MNWKIFAGLFLVGLAGIFFAYKIYNKPHLDVSEADVDFKLNLNTLIDEFVEDQNSAQTKYTDKVLLVSGSIVDFNFGELTSLIIDDGLGRFANCEMAEDSELAKDQLEKMTNSKQQIQIKGLFVGYEDLLGEVQLKKCSIVE